MNLFFVRPISDFETLSWQQLPDGVEDIIVQGVLPETVFAPSPAYPLLQTNLDEAMNRFALYGPEFAREYLETTRGWPCYWLNDREIARRPWIKQVREGKRQEEGGAPPCVCYASVLVYLCVLIAVGKAKTPPCVLTEKCSFLPPTHVLSSSLLLLARVQDDRHTAGDPPRGAPQHVLLPPHRRRVRRVRPPRGRGARRRGQGGERWWCGGDKHGRRGRAYREETPARKSVPSVVFANGDTVGRLDRAPSPVCDRRKLCTVTTAPPHHTHLFYPMLCPARSSHI